MKNETAMLKIAPSRQHLALARIALVSLLSACAVAPEPREPGFAQATRAQQAAAAGQYAEAARLWEEAAGLAADPGRQAYRLRAAQAWLDAGHPDTARSVADLVDDRSLPLPDLSRYGLLQAWLALDEADAHKADFYLQVARPGLTADQQPLFRELRARVETLRADPASHALAKAAAALAAMGSYETGKGVALLQILEDVPSGTLARISEGEIEAPALEDWPRLALHMRRALVARTRLEPAAAAWAEEHPGHAVQATEFSLLGSLYRQHFVPPSQVAVLLPREGGLAASGAAIRDGLLSAYLDNPAQSSLRFYATGDDPQSAVSAYFEAMNAGAEWIIGPLRRESVQALAELGSLGAPALVLNELHDPTGSVAGGLLYSLSLSQEDEARAVARKALELGNARAVTIAVDSSWGNRMEAAFSGAFEAGGGSIVAAGRFSPLENDHSALLTGLLKINESRDRKNRLQATLGLTLAFEPTRRDDFDMIFLVADPDQGRQIRPQLRFHDAGDKEVFAMGRIYNGKPDPAADQDLNGVAFPSTAWQQQAGREFPIPGFNSLRNGSLGHLFALGADAWDLIPWLALLQKDPDLAFPGAIGAIRLAADGNLIREPAWSVFSGGQATPASWPPPDL